MTDGNDRPEQGDNPRQQEQLRRRAEAIATEEVRLARKGEAALSPEDVLQTVHDLRVHQIELEMQNEELRRAQAELDVERVRYFDLYDLAPVGYFTVGDTGLILESNLAAATLLGTTRASLVNERPSRFIRPEWQDVYYLQRKKLAASGTSQMFELGMVKSSGEAFWASLQISAASTENDRLACRVVMSDITERKQLEQDLNHSLQELEALKERLEGENVYLREEVERSRAADHAISDSAAMKACLQQIERVAPTSATVLITGETGAGKEMVARMLHDLSGREGPLVTIDCAALPASLIESELFGHERGAFTGAVARKLGRLELADRGTLFLDEIGEIPIELQTKLLRVLQEQEFQRVGGVQTLAFGGRVVAATNRNLEQAIAAGQFRSDLYYRLRVFPIAMPSLRERKEDIPLLVEHLAAKLAHPMGRVLQGVSPRFLDHVVKRDWPGNVRELENFILRALIVGGGPLLDLEDSIPTEPLVTIPALRPRLRTRLREFEREEMLVALRQSDWVIEGERGAAVRLELAPSTLRSKMRKLGLDRDS